MKKNVFVFLLFGILVFISSSGISFSDEGWRGEYEVDEYTIALWHMNEGSGNIIYDETSNNNDGLINGANWTDGKFEDALIFDGFNDYVFISDSESFLTQYEVTLEAWIKRNSYADGTVFSKNGPFYLGVRNNKASCDIFAGDWWHGFVNGTTDLEPNIWYHIACTYDGSNIKLYVNGIEEESVPKTGDILMHSHSVYIGWGEPGQNQYFNGTIDEVRISNIARNFTSVIDTDNDGIPDEDDNCITTFNPPQTDLDNDSVGDWCDNCILQSNPDQIDVNRNYIGDACEGCSYKCTEFCAWEGE